MGGKTAPTANGYVISISLAGRISRGSREKVSIVKKNLIDFPWNQDPVKKNRIIIDVSRPRKTTALVKQRPSFQRLFISAIYLLLSVTGIIITPVNLYLSL